MSKKFRKLIVPEGYRHYWSKYPEGYTILEALLNWVDSVNQLTENVNDWNIYLDDFVENFDEKLKPTVREMLNEMESDGRLAEIINEEIFSWKADKEYVDEQLAQTVNEIEQTEKKMNNELRAIKQRKPMISIIDDDGRGAFLNTWLPLLQTKTFKIDISVITGLVGGGSYLTWEELGDLKDNYNVDLVNHSHVHPDLDTLTESQLREEFEVSKKELYSRGHYSGDILIYPRGISTHQVRRVATDYFRGAFFDLGGTNFPPFYTYNMRRMTLFNQSSMTDIDTLKGYVDNVIDDNGWLVFISHSQFSGFNREIIEEFIDYVNSQDIEWVHASEGFDRMGNIVDIGDNEDTYEGGVPASIRHPYKVIDCDGITHSNIDNGVYYQHDAQFSTPISEFPRGKYSFSYILTDNETVNDFPEGAGILETFHGQNPVYSFQRFKPYNSNETYLRRWLNNNSWSGFQRTSNTETTSTDIGFNSHITDFSERRISHSVITNSNTTVDLFPEGAGVLETYRIGSTTYAYQKYKPLSSNDLYQRQWTGSGWGEFERVGADSLRNSEYTFESPPSAFKSNIVTTSILTNDTASGFPEGAGTLMTYRNGPYQYNYQTYKPIASNSLYIRTSNGSGSAWNAFTKL